MRDRLILTDRFARRPRPGTARPPCRGSDSGPGLVASKLRAGRTPLRPPPPLERRNVAETLVEGRLVKGTLSGEGNTVRVLLHRSAGGTAGTRSASWRTRYSLLELLLHLTPLCDPSLPLPHPPPPHPVLWTVSYPPLLRPRYPLLSSALTPALPSDPLPVPTHVSRGCLQTHRVFLRTPRSGGPGSGVGSWGRQGCVPGFGYLSTPVLSSSRDSTGWQSHGGRRGRRDLLHLFLPRPRRCPGPGVGPEMSM